MTGVVPSVACQGGPAEGRRIQSLDGLRAISIALVLLGHLAGTQGFGHLDLGIGDYAHLGVTVFFVISGFLITGLLLSDERRGKISLKLFYARRCLRLFPAAYAYIAILFGFTLAGKLHLTESDFWHAATYTVNYLADASWQVGHLWSLSVEEQFYLLWPFALVALGSRRAIWAAVAMIVLGPLGRADSIFFMQGKHLNAFPMVADSLAAGCLLARMRGWLERQGWYTQLFRPVPSFVLLVMVLLTNRLAGYALVLIFGTSLINIAVAILIHRSVCRSDDWAGQVLNWKPISFIGVLSYSLYLWQQPFLNRHSTGWVNAFPQNLGLAVAAALASYLLLEKPLLKLRHRLRT